MKTAHKSLIGLSLLASIAYNGCTHAKADAALLETKVHNAVVRTIDGIKYEFSGNKVTQMTSDKDNEAKYCVISDAHGETEKAKAIASRCKSVGVDGIALLGDIAKNERLRYDIEDEASDQKEIEAVIAAFAETKLPIFVIPGNHETKPDYENALADITKQFQNVIDMAKYRIFDGDDVDFVSLPGYDQKYLYIGGQIAAQFIPDNGYLAGSSDIKSLANLAKGLDDKIVLLSHGCAKVSGNITPDQLRDGRQVGSKEISEAMKKAGISYQLCGHIHESGGIAADFSGNRIKPNTYADQFVLNSGTLEKWAYNQPYNSKAIHEGMAAVLEIKGKQAKFNIITLE